MTFLRRVIYLTYQAIIVGIVLWLLFMSGSTIYEWGFDAGFKYRDSIKTKAGLPNE